ncbi:type I-E CRISPR-associated protein Cse2/CasB [Tessaracoccus defluvii]|uniref:Type I-E CRISPR-associated protein Cse2/CasB n=1 Tax=Tessaracoccus defluvii TaxID=1285901 RepID=A0A7H0H2F5_9ACTN|nr:type I-E CRISPR-associated protein Cse2/CasB [Tessaracoccus defluvii]QNP54721.1 type I-E CRISPR-associated protein Cse2/CasB [Tessaracoccus defluvii]
MSSDFKVGSFVTRRIHQLVGADPGRMSPNSKALLAQLRQAAAAEPGTAPAVWAVTLEGIPADLPRGYRERAEQAVHIALTQFAVHQQSRSRNMHDPKQPFGRAVRRLADISNKAEPHESPVYRRFTAMSTASTLPGLLAHSRGLITQLRTHEIAFDYGRYAEDLYWFLAPSGARDVHRRWGRDFHYLQTESNEGVSE